MALKRAKYKVQIKKKINLTVKPFRNEIHFNKEKNYHYSEDVEINKYKSENVEIFKYLDPLIRNTIVVCAEITARIITGNKILPYTR